MILLVNEGKATDVVCFQQSQNTVISLKEVAYARIFFLEPEFLFIMTWQNSTDTSIVLCGCDSLSNKNPSSKFKLVFPVTPMSGKTVH